MADQPETVDLPWRVEGLDGFNSEQGPTFDGGWFTGGGSTRHRSITVRLLAPMGRPASVQLDLCDDRHGCTASLSPQVARDLAAALAAGAAKADAEMAHWRQVLDKQRAEIQELMLREYAARAGEPTDG